MPGNKSFKVDSIDQLDIGQYYWVHRVRDDIVSTYGVLLYTGYSLASGEVDMIETLHSDYTYVVTPIVPPSDDDLRLVAKGWVLYRW